jgi:DNA-binding response OmpR family regulator
MFMPNHIAFARMPTGSDALAELRENHRKYNLVILDLMLPPGEPTDTADEIPNMPLEEIGEFVFEKMGDICPNMPTMVLTSVRSNLEGMRQAPNAELMMKPVTISELLHKIDVMLKGSGDGGKAGRTVS